MLIVLVKHPDPTVGKNASPAPHHLDPDPQPKNPKRPGFATLSMRLVKDKFLPGGPAPQSKRPIN